MDGASNRVLVVDDDKRLLDIYQQLLTQHQLAPTICSDSSKVLAVLKAGTFDLVLLDIRMPGIEGTDLLPLIKKVRPLLPVILVSAYCDPNNAHYYQALGAYAAIEKPFSNETLIDTIRRAINQEERIPVILTTLSLRDSRDTIYRKLILTALRKTNWNQLKAAELLGVSRFCLIRWIKKLGIAV